MRRIFFSLSLVCLLAARRAHAQDFILDLILPGSTTAAELRAHFGEPIGSETVGALKVERFEAKKRKLQEATFWLNAEGVVQWTQVRPSDRITPDTAALLFALTTEPAKVDGHAFLAELVHGTKTHHYCTSGVHFVVRNDTVAEIWFTVADAVPSSIREALNGTQDTLPLGAWLGLRIGHMTHDAAQDLGVTDKRGALVTGLFARGPAIAAGLAPEDVIRKVNGKAIASREAYIELMKSMRPGERVALDILRRKAPRRVLALLAQNPATAGGAAPPLVQHGLAWTGLLIGRGQGGRGAVVRNVSRGSPAEKARLRGGDELVAWQGRPIVDSMDALLLMDRCQPRERVELAVSRGGRQYRASLVAEPVLPIDGGRVTRPVTVREWGLVVQELNPATARALRVMETRGLSIRHASPRTGVSTDDARRLAGTVILRVDGIPASRTTSLSPWYGARPACRVLWAKGRLSGAFILRQPQSEQ